jgi:hypothetical protein
MHQKFDALFILFFSIFPKKTFFEFSSCLTFSPSSSIVTMEVFWQKIENKTKVKTKTFLCHGLLTFATREALLPLPLQNMLDHDFGQCRHLGKVKFHGPGTSSTADHIF